MLKLYQTVLRWGKRLLLALHSEQNNQYICDQSSNVITGLKQLMTDNSQQIATNNQAKYIAYLVKILLVYSYIIQFSMKPHKF